jgi:MtN3 and saliva related transmembrane protein
MRNSLHHLRQRERPHTRFDRAMFVVGALGPISTFPQIYTIFFHHNASGVSAISWIIYTLLSIVWLIYGLVHKEKVIIFSNILWILMNSLVAIGAIIY